ncbi:hypothetical protein [Dietzia kunjamensis]|uniref:hypothetical protein n=2 Tax=Dietzia kunjamensis TaxID=322509 RepID=UPI0039BD622E
MWHDRLMYVVTIDQRRSRSSADRVPALIDALADIPTAAAFERTAGDEVQGLLDDPAAVRSTLLVALREGDWHCGVGAGDVDDESYSSGTRAGRGDAYLAARDAVDAAKGLPGSVAIRVPGDPGSQDDRGSATAWAADCEAVWALVAPLVLGRTEAQWRVVDAVDRSPTQVAAAEELGITPASVTGALRLAQIREERASYPVLDRLLAGAHDAAVGGAGSPASGQRGKAADGGRGKADR